MYRQFEFQSHFSPFRYCDYSYALYKLLGNLRERPNSKDRRYLSSGVVCSKSFLEHYSNKFAFKVFSHLRRRSLVIKSSYRARQEKYAELRKQLGPGVPIGFIRARGVKLPGRNLPHYQGKKLKGFFRRQSSFLLNGFICAQPLRRIKSGDFLGLAKRREFNWIASKTDMLVDYKINSGILLNRQPFSYKRSSLRPTFLYKRGATETWQQRDIKYPLRSTLSKMYFFRV